MADCQFQIIILNHGAVCIARYLSVYQSVIKNIKFLSGEDSPLLAAESFNF